MKAIHPFPASGTTKRIFGSLPDGQVVTEFTLQNPNGLQCRIIDLGCAITSLYVPDQMGDPGDIVLGFDSIDGYLRSRHYAGAIAGRVANRIGHGRFELNGKTYFLENNLPPHHLHGGKKGFDKVIWNSKIIDSDIGTGIEFTHLSLDGEEGYPGNLTVSVKYILQKDDSLHIEYTATTDAATIINLTQHSYFNLSNHPKDVFGHQLQIHAHQMLETDHTSIPTGHVMQTDGTPFDFSTKKVIGRQMDFQNELIKNANGFDHYWILDKTTDEPELAASLSEEMSGRLMDVYTTAPGLQLYTGNFLDDLVPGKMGIINSAYAGLCIETQGYPDAPNHPTFPSILLNPNEVYRSKTIWKFSII